MTVSPFSMDPNCNLELRLSLSPLSSHSSDNHFMAEESSKTPQQLTIFYNGKVCVGEFTEHQARAILKLATRQMEERTTSRTKQETSSSSPKHSNAAAASGLSMKRSLQKFLQKRKHRIQAASPYNH